MFVSIVQQFEALNSTMYSLLYSSSVSIFLQEVQGQEDIPSFKTEMDLTQVHKE